MKTPLIDPRTQEDVQAQIRARAREYTPEWKCQGDPTDPGTALSQLFGEMFYQTIDRYNALPKKYYTEFLNLLGVAYPEPAPASGYVAFEVHESAEAPVLIPENTQVAAISEEGESVIFETTRQIGATPAQLRDIYFCSARENLLQRLDMESGSQNFLAPTEGENLQCHRLFISENDVLDLSGACYIEVEIAQTPAFIENATAAKLTDPSFAAWTWFDGEKDVPFDEAAAEGSCITLTKSDPRPFQPDEEGRIGISCTMQQAEGAIVLDGVRLRSRPEKSLAADELTFGDTLLSDEGGYCFGRRPAVYDFFYIRSDSVFQKKNARIMLNMDLTVLPEEPEGAGAQYDWSQRVINKDSAVALTPDDVFVSRVAWEYFNGLGWAPLRVSGNQNPFSGKDDGALNLVFDLPGDMQSVAVNAEEGYYIRARVVEVENFLSTNARWLQPFVKSIECSWQYDCGRPVSYISARNNGGLEEIEDAASYKKLSFAVFQPMEDLPRSMYFRFDRSPDAMPLSMLFEIETQGSIPGKVIFESLSGGRFSRIRTIDSTRNFRHTGSVYLYLTRPLESARLFGEEGCWLRCVCTDRSYDNKIAPRVSSVRLNAVIARQSQIAEEQVFSTVPLDRDKRIELLFTPILDCNVWVDEISRLVAADALMLEEAMPGLVQLEREGPEIRHCWICWERVSRLGLAGPDDRVYELDEHSGVISFGSGRNGRMPPEGAMNIRVKYTYGGGEAGNLPAGAINVLVGAIPMVNGVSGITPTCGGVGRISEERLEHYGNRRLRHRGRAIGISDFEEMVMERFPRASCVKCFSGRDESGEEKTGHVTVVVMCSEADSEYSAEDLCEEIYVWLSQRCNCALVEAGKLHVLPALELTVNIEAHVTMRDLDKAAQTQEQLAEGISAIISRVWRSREIGNQVRINEIDQLLKNSPNVSLIQRVLVEGQWSEGGVKRACNLAEDRSFPYATVKDGNHTIWIS